MLTDLSVRECLCEVVRGGNESMRGREDPVFPSKAAGVCDTKCRRMQTPGQ